MGRRLHLRFCSRFGWIPICISAYTTWVLFRSFKMSTYLPQPSTPSVLDLIELTPEDWEEQYRDYTEYRAFMLQCKHDLIARGHAVWQTYSDQKNERNYFLTHIRRVCNFHLLQQYIYCNFQNSLFQNSICQKKKTKIQNSISKFDISKFDISKMKINNSIFQKLKLQKSSFQISC